MKTKTLVSFVALLALLSTINYQLSAAPLGTAFTYQGKLSSGPGAVTGLYDFNFTLWNAYTNGSQLGATNWNGFNALPVTNGVFSVTLDFGGSAFTGDARWLEIAVRTNGSPAGYYTLPARLALLPAPQALWAQKAGTAANGAVSASSLNTPEPPTPGQVLTYNGSQLTWTNPSSTGAGWSLTGNSGTTGANFVGTTDNHPLEFRVNNTGALRLEYSNSFANVIVNPAWNSVATWGSSIGGGSGNDIGFPAAFSVIAGGLGNHVQGSPDSAAGNAAIGGGLNNVIEPAGTESVIGGGQKNRVQSNVNSAVISGGVSNSISPYADAAAISGGANNLVGPNAAYAAISGGGSNSIGASASYAAIAGGENNYIRDSSDRAVIAGGRGNSIWQHAAGAAIGGGENSLIDTSADHATISGGADNGIGQYSAGAAIGGGEKNSIWGDANAAAIGGGEYNTISAYADHAVIAGGGENMVATNASYAAIGGGRNNHADAVGATVPGGRSNRAGGFCSFAAGSGAQALHKGSFVWADSQVDAFFSTAFDQVSFRCQGGVVFASGVNGNNQGVSWAPGDGAWSYSSDRRLKEGFAAVDGGQILERVLQLPISEWNFKGCAQRHVGPMAQDFHAAFPLNTNETTLNGTDLHGVALAAIQGLNQKVEDKEARIQEQTAQIADLEARLERLERLLSAQSGR